MLPKVSSWLPRAALMQEAVLALVSGSDPGSAAHLLAECVALSPHVLLHKTGVTTLLILAVCELQMRREKTCKAPTRPPAHSALSSYSVSTLG